MTASDVIGLVTCALLGYVLGSVNVAVIIAKRHGVDILQAGSGNPGATNVKRVLGKRLGNLVFGLDALKGAAGAWLPALLVASVLATEVTFIQQTAGFIGVLLGHCFSCFLGFRGGKGVASTIGGLLVLLTVPVLVGALLWALVFFSTRYVSLASITLGLSLPLSCWFLPQVTGLSYGREAFIVAAFLAGFNVWTHRSNLARLLRGEENRFAKSKDNLS
jgi:glycerol-3-phosphate acyltransferase PlsY